ncbi:Nif3-like dinuclear metal center hexameric protein [Acidihalobacter ferrooxydans]|uniref:GTP cyclohydrolase 1 type 2 homolog n=1 Tax=Acidihalobacter ferrooxydans TaxID=1765967 RepID=A0A1P8UF32_9GAMM|nr:Nif3-like dinuclear metal center hexameric protein [Acidihalobacter ferrooxydans]APZ42463.1 Nif3-like dinuclear metal center hexameric protein [Acidihalobacter ferrooxydans]
MARLGDIVAWCDELLQPNRFRDYCPNGLQVEGREEVRTLVSGVTATQALIDAALDLNADAILVHHGYFWRGEDARVIGMRRKRLRSLLANDLSLIAYHLPLDAHPEVGNNAQLAARLGLQFEASLNTEGVGSLGHLAAPMRGVDFAQHIERTLGRAPVWVDGGPERIERIAWCTGGAQGYIEQAADAGVDAYLSGEISEQTTHVARERGLHYFAAGHHATERYGAPALGERLATRFALTHHFVDIDNPA